MGFIDFSKYENIPFKHLGDSREGIDCFNLCKLIYKEELGIILPYSSSDFCNIVDVDWYQKTTDNIFEDNAALVGFTKTSKLEPFNILLFSIGSTNITNHCGLLINTNTFIHTLEGKNSFISSYGNYYKQYTVGMYKWISKN